jgi:hypothetical protein
MDSQRIFISYRRRDSGGYAGRLYGSLQHRFPDAKIFMGVEAFELGSGSPNTARCVLGLQRSRSSPDRRRVVTPHATAMPVGPRVQMAR